MLKKSSYLVILIAVLLIVGCDSQPVSPLNSKSNQISGETKLVKSVNPGTTKELESGDVQIRNRIMVFEDTANDNQLSGMRNIVFNHNYNKNKEGHCYGTFTITTDSGQWEGDWRGTTTSSITVINAIGYSLDEREKYCEWTYSFSNLEDLHNGTYTAKIFYDDRDEQF